MSKCCCSFIDGVRVNPYCPIHGLNDREKVYQMLEERQSYLDNSKRELLIKSRLEERKSRIRPKERNLKHFIRREILEERRENAKLFPISLCY